ncbi:hypothetical protein MnTg02_00996 [bacterium MnTg02]|nr:hypothetical protein MnTg02_00996 [bacterium MnTg02]
MQADQTARVLQWRSDVFDRQRRGVGGQHSAGLQPVLQPLEDFLLNLEILDDRFDDDVGARHMLAFDIGNEPRHCGVDRDLRAQPLTKELLCALQRNFDLLGRHILQADFHARHHAPGRDIATHGPRADDMSALRLKAILGRLRLKHLGEAEDAPQRP